MFPVITDTQAHDATVAMRRIAYLIETGHRSIALNVNHAAALLAYVVALEAEVNRKKKEYAELVSEVINMSEGKR